jgi:anaerobic selenocysteine-containing dehydrogenase
MAGLQYLYDPSRVKTPLKKENGKFKAISWDEAVSLVAGKLSQLRKEGKSSSLGCITGNENGSLNAMFKRFLDAFGSSNAYTMPSLESNLALTAATLHGAGKTIGFDP